jgi:hypothetical protein
MPLARCRNTSSASGSLWGRDDDSYITNEETVLLTRIRETVDAVEPTAQTIFYGSRARGDAEAVRSKDAWGSDYARIVPFWLNVKRDGIFL